MKPKRVLICGFTGNYGGMEAYIMNIYRNIDRTKLQFDFLYPYEDKMAFSDEVLKLGGHIYHVPGRKKSPAAHYRLLKKLFKEHQFAGMYYQWPYNHSGILDVPRLFQSDKSTSS